MDGRRPYEGTSADKTFIPTGQSKQSLLTSPYLVPESSPTCGPGTGPVSPAMPTMQHAGGIEVVHDSHGLHPTCGRCNLSTSQVNSVAEEKIVMLSPRTVVANSWPGSNGQSAWNSTAGLVPVEQKRIWGLRSTTFYLSLSNVLLVLGLIALGVYHAIAANRGGNVKQAVPDAGVCVGTTNNTNTNNAPSKPLDGPNPQICFDTRTPPVSRSQYGTTRSQCPGAVDRRYTVPGTNLTFARTCGVDYTDNDLGRLPTSTIEDCIALCAQLNLYPSSGQGACLGVTWIFGGTQGEGMSYCYPKYKVDKTGPGRSDLESAILVTGGMS